MIRTYEEIYDDLQNTFLANQNKITDMNNASIIKAFLVAVATEESRKYIETEMSFTESIKKIPLSIFGFEKKQGTFATGKVVFSSNEPVAFNVVIPIGTVVSGGGFTFETQAIATIPNGATESNEVFIIAQKVGVAQNLDIGGISGIETVVSDEVKKVKNFQKLENGSDEESDNEALARFKSYINGLQGTSVYGLKSACLATEGVRSVSIIEGFDVSGLYDVTVFAEDGNGRLKANTKQLLESVINGDGTAIKPGKRSPGINIEVKEPSVIDLDIEVMCEYAKTDLELARTTVENGIKKCINSLGIGQDVVVSDIIREIRTYPFIKDIVVTRLINSDDEEEENAIVPNKWVIAQDQIARYHGCVITMNVVTGD